MTLSKLTSSSQTPTAMEKIRVTNFTNPQEFLDAVKSHDDSFMNFAIGSLLDSLDEASARARMLTTNHRTLICVHKGEKLLLATIPLIYLE